MHWAGPCARCGQLATQHLPLPHSPIGCRSLPDLGTPRVPQRGFVGSAQLGQKALVVVSQRAVRLHVGDGPLLGLPSQSGHQEGHSLGFTWEAGSLKDHEPVHLHQEPRQLARVSRERFRQRGGRCGHGSSSIGGDGRDRRSDLQSARDTRPGAQQCELRHHALQHVGEVGLLGSQRGGLAPQCRVGESQGGQGVSHIIHLCAGTRGRGWAFCFGGLRLDHSGKDQATESWRSSAKGPGCLRRCAQTESGRTSLGTLVLSWMQFLSASFAGSRCEALAGLAQVLKDVRAGPAQPLQDAQTEPTQACSMSKQDLPRPCGMSGLGLPRPCRMHRLDLPRPYGMRRPALPRLGGMHLPEFGLRVKALPAGATRLPAREQRWPHLSWPGPGSACTCRSAAPSAAKMAHGSGPHPACASPLPPELLPGRRWLRFPRGWNGWVVALRGHRTVFVGARPARQQRGTRQLGRGLLVAMETTRSRSAGQAALPSGSDAAPPPGPCAFLSSLSTRSMGSAFESHS